MRRQRIAPGVCRMSLGRRGRFDTPPAHRQHDHVEEAAAKCRAERAGNALKVADERRERAAKVLADSGEALDAAQAEARAALRAQEEAQAKLDAL